YGRSGKVGPQEPLPGRTRPAASSESCDAPISMSPIPDQVTRFGSATRPSVDAVGVAGAGAAPLAWGSSVQPTSDPSSRAAPTRTVPVVRDRPDLIAQILPVEMGRREPTPAEDTRFELVRVVNPTRFPSVRPRPLGESSAGKDTQGRLRGALG